MSYHCDCSNMWSIFMFFGLFNSQFGIINAADEGDEPCNKTPGGRAITILRDKLFCKYDKYSRPVQNVNKTVNVNISASLQNVEMVENRLLVRMTLSSSWMDEYLSWDPIDNVRYIHLTGTDIWTPDLKLEFRERFDNTLTFDTETCVLLQSGLVNCHTSLSLTIHCFGNYRHWPYDEHTCSFEIGSFAYYEHELNITLLPHCTKFDTLNKCTRTKLVSLNNFIPNSAWELVDATATKLHASFDWNATYSFLEFQFSVKRHAAAYQATTVYPCIASLFAILSTFWMGTLTKIRVIISCTIFITSTTYMSYLIYVLPSNGDYVPVLLVLYRDASILSIVAIITAILIRSLIDKSTTPPLWLSGITDFLHDRSPLNILLCLKMTITKSGADDETAILAGNAKIEGPWAPVAYIIDRFSFFISLITVIVLLLGYTN